jgi:syntaxin 1B/2/3
MSSRYDGSNKAYREVQERHEEIKRIEQTLAELAQLFNDVGFLCLNRRRSELTF